MQNQKYSSSTRDSFLQALGPFREQISSTAIIRYFQYSTYRIGNFSVFGTRSVNNINTKDQKKEESIEN